MQLRLPNPEDTEGWKSLGTWDCHNCHCQNHIDTQRSLEQLLFLLLLLGYLASVCDCQYQSISESNIHSPTTSHSKFSYTGQDRNSLLPLLFLEMRILITEGTQSRAASDESRSLFDLIYELNKNFQSILWHLYFSLSTITNAIGQTFSRSQKEDLAICSKQLHKDRSNALLNQRVKKGGLLS